MNHVYVPLTANIGNSMFAYMMGALLHKRSGARLYLKGSGLSCFNIEGVSAITHAFTQLRWRLERREFHKLRKSAYADLDKEVALLEEGSRKVFVAWPLKLNISLYQPYLEHYDQCFRPVRDHPGYGDEYLLVNIRLAAIARGTHDHYSPLPLSWYRHLEQRTGKKLVFMGQLDDGYYSRQLRRSFPGAVFLRHESALQDFQIIRNSVNIALSISTFSFMAAWLSRTARTIYMPVWGLYDPRTRENFDLIPRNDPRYVTYQFQFDKTDANAEGNPLVDPGFEPFRATQVGGTS